MIDFKTVLKEVVRAIPGSLVAMIVGRDGIIVESYQSAAIDLDCEVLGAEYSGVVSEVHKQISILKLDDLKDITVCSDLFTVVAHIISQDYYFVIFLNSQANEGLARYKTRVYSLKLRELM
jgi:predicted regulator of Ras-like GTPase activity (Roadblock/LC7/MglB family)